MRLVRVKEAPAQPGKAVRAEVFNGATLFEFLRQLVQRYDGRKVFLIIDNAPCHQLEDDGLRWLHDNRHRIELHRLPAYSPEFMAMEGVWKTTRELTTHNAFFVTPDQRDAKLTETFNLFQRRLEVIAAHVARFRLSTTHARLFSLETQ